MADVTTLQAQVGVVLAPRPGAAEVQIGSRIVLARNALNVRTPPGSRVIVAQDPTTRTWAIIGRER